MKLTFQKHDDFDKPRVSNWRGFFVLRLLPILIYTFTSSFVGAGNPFIPEQKRQRNEFLPVDTTSAIEETIYQVKRLRLLMILSYIDRPGLIEEIVELKNFAESAAAEKDYKLANIYLDEIFTCVDSSAAIWDRTGEPASFIENTPLASGTNSNFEKGVVVGIDFSHQEFDLTFGQGDSAYVEGVNNPFFGFAWEYQRNVGEKQQSDFSGLLKLSRDYYINELQGRLQFNSQSTFSTEFYTNEELVIYRRHLPMRYFQSLLGFSLDKTFFTVFNFQFQDEIQYRYYWQSTEEFPNYWRNHIYLCGNFFGLALSRVSLLYDWEKKQHPTAHDYDYDDQRWGIQFYHSWGWRSNTTLWIQHRQMDYSSLVPDSTYHNDFRQESLFLTMRQNLGGALVAKLNAEFDWRFYKLSNSFTPNFQYYRLEPMLVYEFNSQFSLGCGMLYEMKKYQYERENVNFGLEPEDYHIYGLVIDIDYFNLKGIILSFSHTFSLTRYPGSPTGNIPGLSLYTDRNENNTMLYFSWQALKSVEINLVAHYDNDRDVEIEHNDSRSSLFTLDVAYKF